MKATVKRLLGYGVAAVLLLASVASAQRRPYIGYTYPAGGQQGTTFRIKLGGQDLDDVNAVFVSGAGVTARVLEYYRKLNPQEIQLLNEQLRELRRAATAGGPAMAAMMAPENSMMMMASMSGPEAPAAAGGVEPVQAMIARVEKRTREHVQLPACASISSLVIVEVTVAADAPPGGRELRLGSPRGVTNPLVFHVGQLPEYSRKPMNTSPIQVLGKEALALRKRPAEEVEDLVVLPCILNGQVGPGEVNRYRFMARQGQRLVISAQARQLIPYIADAVPGWFQPVLVLSDAQGKELAYADDYRFKPDPVILFEVPRDGEYVIAIHDAIYRGREDFVYRLTVGEVPYVTSVFPLGVRVGAAVVPDVQGWNLPEAGSAPLTVTTGPGVQSLSANRQGLVSNRVPFAVDNLPEIVEQEGNDTTAAAQKVTLPVIVNGRIDRPDDWDVFQFSGKANATVVVEVQARRLESPLDSVIKVTDASGALLAFNDDHEDLASGINTHHADSYLMLKLPADGVYHVHIGDTARQGGREYGYRLRISPPRPDFELRVVASSASVRVKGTTAVSVYALRKDGYAGPIRLALRNPPEGFSATPVTLPANQAMVRFNIRGGAERTTEPVSLSIIGGAKIGARDVVREALPAEDRMQAFLWRHLVPARDLKVAVIDPNYQPPARRPVPSRPPAAVAAVPTETVAAATAVLPGGANGVAAAAPAPVKPKFTKQQITGRLRQLKLLYEEGLLTDDFYLAKVAECDASQ